MPLRRPKYFPRSRLGTHSWIHAFQFTPAMAAKQLAVRNQAMRIQPAVVGLSRGIHGMPTPSASHVTRCRLAAVTVSVLGGFHLARVEATMIWRKLPMKGRALTRPMVVFGRGNAKTPSA